MRKFIGVLIGLGLIAFGVIAFLGQSNVSQRNGNIDDFYAGLVMGGGLGFAGLVTLYAVLKNPKKPIDPNEVEAVLWAAAMTSLASDDGDADLD